MSNLFKNVSAAILAGGLGTRLRSVVADRPKVLAQVAGRPFLAYLLDRLHGAGIRETVLLVGHGADQVRSAFGDRYAEMHLAYSAETEPLGTAGAVRLALPLFRGNNILLLNGDSYCDVDFQALLDLHTRRGCKATLTLAHVENASRFGRVVLGPDDRITRFEEKNPAPESGWINAGIYLFERHLLDSIASGIPVSFERNFLPNLVEQGAVYGYRGGNRFIDIGVPESYGEAEAFFANG